MKLSAVFALSFFAGVFAAPKPVLQFEWKDHPIALPSEAAEVNSTLVERGSPILKRVTNASCYGSGAQTNPTLIFRTIDDICNTSNGRVVPGGYYTSIEVETQPNSPSRSTLLIFEFFLENSRYSRPWTVNADHCKQTLKFIVNMCKHANREYEFCKGGTGRWQASDGGQYRGRVDPQFEEIGRG